MRIWHDNSGRGNRASWFLKHLIINDLQTNERFYFICEKWFAFEKEDGLIHRILPVSDQIQKENLKYLISSKTKLNMSDNHLWFSIFNRPVHSSFTRIERITCCFVLFFISMMVNIIYYENDFFKQDIDFQIGPFYLTREQFTIGMLSSLIILLPNLILVELFRRSKKRVKKNSTFKYNK